MAAPGEPYWLIREDGREVGMYVVDFSEAITAEKALDVFAESWRVEWQHLLGDPPPVTASLVVLTYEDGKPFVKAVT